MPVGIKRVISVSSEDPAYPATNLMKSDNNKKWRCKTGEKQASVILELQQETVIEGIDIGNENSAFVEVLVGKSSSPNSEFKVLLVASSLMTLKESKDGTNTNGVRFFKKSDLSTPSASEKWDRVKVVCTQPFNKHVSYGLSFIVLHATGQATGDADTSLGRFALKEEEKDEPVSVGSWFAKRKDPPPPVPPGAAAAIRDASSPAGIAQGKNKKPKTPRMPKNTTPKNGVLKTPKDDNPPTSKKTPKAEVANSQKSPKPVVNKNPPAKLDLSFGDEDSPADDTDADSTYSPNKDNDTVLSDDDEIPDESDEEDVRDKRPKRKTKDDELKNAKNGQSFNGQNAKRKNSDSGGSKTKMKKVSRETKPFGRLLEGVTIVISGYQNPLRGELRSKACAMGAKYKADWDHTCTHLICAFVNTPKFNQVRGRGKIVKKDWVLECHGRRRRLPWRRFALDGNDAGTSSEDEVWEEESVPSTSVSSSSSNVIASGVNRRRVSSGSDTEEEIERVRARQAASNTPVGVDPAGTDRPADVDPFGADTDPDTDSDCATGHLPLPPLPHFFDNVVFHIGCDVDLNERRQLQRYIIAYQGSVVDDIDGSVEYVITSDQDVAAELVQEYGVTAVSSEWVWQCSDAQKLIPVDDFILA